MKKFIAVVVIVLLFAAILAFPAKASGNMSNAGGVCITLAPPLTGKACGDFWPSAQFPIYLPLIIQSN